MNVLIRLLGILKCAFCRSKMCHARYKLGTSIYLIGKGNTKYKCPKKQEK